MIPLDVEPISFRLGTVRYTSTARLHRSRAEDLVLVKLEAADFLARRTGVFGMTRTGKSNAMKHIVSAVKTVADKQNVPIGQLLFDIRGEYASANVQDLRGSEASSLADAFPDGVESYRTVPTAGFHHILNNFYVQVEEGLDILQELLRGSGRELSQDVESLLTLRLVPPDQDDDRSTWTRYKLRLAAYHCLLYRAGFEPPKHLTIKFDTNDDVRQAVTPYWTDRRNCALPNPSDALSIADAADWLDCARSADLTLHQSLVITAIERAGGTVPANPTAPALARAADAANVRMKGPGLLRTSSGHAWFPDDTRALLNSAARRSDTNVQIRGWRAIEAIRAYHSPARSDVAEEEIYQRLRAGRIVIIDLSVGNALIRDRVTQRLARHIFSKSQEIFLEGNTPPTIMIYIEEAHNYIDKTAKPTETWPLLAKEGAKFRIGLVYATQEPSNIHPSILSNTENWIVTHLNNDDELHVLGKFYDFKDFERSLKSATDVGFARVRTLSRRFVVPIQIDKFAPESTATVRPATQSRVR